MIEEETISMIPEGYRTILGDWIRRRGIVGLETYGKTMDRDDLTPKQWVVHGIEENLDSAQYCVKLKNVLPSDTQKVEAHDLATANLMIAAALYDILETLPNE